MMPFCKRHWDEGRNHAAALPTSSFRTDDPFFEATIELAGDASLGLLLIADHARNHVPPGLGDLGLDPSVFSATSPMTSASRG